MVWIIKKDGTKEEFDEQRLLASLLNAGATSEMAEAILKKIRKKLHDGISTSKIYHLAFKTLKKMDLPASSRYQVKWALMRLGDHGFPFEHYMEKVLQRLGYETETNQIVKGQYITHEIDIIAKKDGKTCLVECKHHSHLGTLCNIQTALYVYARFLDLKKTFDKAMLVTNTRFSNQVKDYSKGVELGLLGWRYPLNNSMEMIIRETEVYPLTVLQTIKKTMLPKLLNKKIVTVSEVSELSIEKLAYLLNISKDTAVKIRQEACGVLMKKKRPKSSETACKIESLE